MEAGGPKGQDQEVRLVLATADLCVLGVGVGEVGVGSSGGRLGMGGCVCGSSRVW